MNEVFIDMRKQNDYISKHFTKDLVNISELLSTIEDLTVELDNLEEEFENYKQNVSENYKQISNYELYDINERDFI